MKTVKNLLLILLVVSLCTPANILANGQAIQIILDGEKLDTPVNPIIQDGTTLVPMRSILQALGMEIKWDNETKTITGVRNDTVIKLTLGSNIAYVNGLEKDLITPAINNNGTTLVPLRFISEAVGCKVDWDGGSKEIRITTNANLQSTSEVEKSNTESLYVVDGTGEYIGYKMLKGYVGEDKFQVYYEGDPDSYFVTYEDLRNINLDEIISWNYEGKVVRNTRRDLYSLFSNTSEYSSHLGIEDIGLLSPEWFKTTFGQVYWDWAEGIGFSTDAERLVKQYFQESGQSNIIDRTTLRDISFEELYRQQLLNKQWLNNSDLKEFDLKIDFIPEKKSEDKWVTMFIILKESDSSIITADKALLKKITDIPYMKQLNTTITIDSVAIKGENGELYANTADLIKAGLISEK